MASESDSSKEINDILPEHIELLEVLLEPDDATYPWEPTDPETETYFIDREKDFTLEDWSEAEIATRTDNFYAQIEQIWCEISTNSVAEGNGVRDLQADLQQQFSLHVPASWLQEIACKAYQAISTQQSMADKLIQCIQELLPAWSEDDLLVLARPFASVMRGTEPQAVESVLNQMCWQNWNALSEIEQARAGLAIARYALAQLQHPKS